MKQSLSLLKHVPLIRFVGGPHSHAPASSTPKPHPCAPDGHLPSIVGGRTPSVKPIELKEGEVLLRNELPKRFRYTPPSQAEVEQVVSGGAELIF